eukprot:759148-Prymnesium_polylepis.1
MTIDAVAMQPVAPPVIETSDGQSGYSFEVQMLQTSLDVMYSRLSAGGVTPTLTMVPSNATTLPIS